MDTPTLKQLKKLADICRKVGIKSFKCPAFEFTLTEDIPVSNYKKAKEDKVQQQEYNDKVRQIQSEALTEEQLLFFSTPDEELNA